MKATLCIALLALVPVSVPLAGSAILFLHGKTKESKTIGPRWAATNRVLTAKIWLVPMGDGTEPVLTIVCCSSWQAPPDDGDATTARGAGTAPLQWWKSYSAAF